MAPFVQFTLAALSWQLGHAQHCFSLDMEEHLASSGTSLIQVQTGFKLKATEPAYYWSGKNGDVLRTGSSEVLVDPRLLEVGPAWSFLEGDAAVVRAAPLIDHKKNIYLATVSAKGYPLGRGVLRKFSPDGKILWNFTDSSTIPDVPSLYNGSVYFTNEKGLVTALDMETGDVVWRKSALVENAKGSAPDTWSMAAAEGTVISAVSSDGSMNDHLVALDAVTGEVRWSFKPDEAIYNILVAITNGSLVFSDYTGKAYRVHLKSGQLLWKAGPAEKGDEITTAFSTGGTVLGPNGIAYVTSNANVSDMPNGFITAFNVSNGNILWRSSTEYAANNGAAVGRIRGRPAVVIGVGENPDMPDPLKQTLLKVGDNASSLKEKKGRVLALDAETGEELWSYDVPVWHGWGAGERLKSVCLPDSFGNAAISGDGTVYVGFQSGHFYGIHDKDSDGKISPDEVSSYDTGRCFQGSPAIAPGMLLVTPCNGLHAFIG